MKIFSFGNLSLTRMKKFILLSFLALSVSLVSAQGRSNGATVKIASHIDSLNYTVYGNIYLLGEETDFYVIANDVKPIQCNKLRVYTYFKDRANGKAENSYWVYQGSFDFEITPYYQSYSLNLKAYSTGDYKVAVSGYMNNAYLKDFGSTTFTVKNDNDILDYSFFD